MTELLGDYSRQATTYDSTRSASPSVLVPLTRALSGSGGVRLADIGGGTGNYSLAFAAEGWEPLVIDRSEQMLAKAAAKGLQTLLADAQSLPLEDESFDAVMLVSMLHHVDRPALALREAIRVLAAGGRLALMLFTLEDISDAWVLKYFPASRPWMAATHISLRQALEVLPGAERLEVVYEDLSDGSMAALLSHPELVLQDRWRDQTSFFERLGRDHPRDLEHGLQLLRDDIQSGCAPKRPGRASVIAWRKPGVYQR